MPRERTGGRADFAADRVCSPDFRNLVIESLIDRFAQEIRRFRKPWGKTGRRACEMDRIGWTWFAAFTVAGLIGSVAGVAVLATPAGAAGFTVSVTPNSGLTDGESVTVSWSNFPTFDSSVTIRQCDATSTTSPGCVGSTSLTVPSSGGSGSTSFVVHDTDGISALEPSSTARCDSAGAGSIYIADNVGATARASITCGTTSHTRPPIAVNDTASTAHNSGVVIPVLANDSDPYGGTFVNVAVASDAQHGHAQCGSPGAGCSYTPNTDYLGSDSFTYTATSSRGPSATATVNVDVVFNAGEPLVSVTDSASGGAPYTPIDSITTHSFDWEGLRPDGLDTLEECEAGRDDALCVNIDGLQPGQLTNNFGALGGSNADIVLYENTFAAGFQCNLASPCELRIHDAIDPALVATGAIVFSGVSPFSYAPIPGPADDSASSTGNAVTIPVLANDVNHTFNGNVPGVVTGWSRSKHGTVTCDSSTCTYTPTPGYSGPDTFGYQESAFYQIAAPGSGTSSVTGAAKVTIDVQAADAILPEAPTAAILPILAAGLVTATAFGRRRRRRRADSCA
jgi:hypothetical protein